MDNHFVLEIYGCSFSAMLNFLDDKLISFYIEYKGVDGNFTINGSDIVVSVGHYNYIPEKKDLLKDFNETVITQYKEKIMKGEISEDEARQLLLDLLDYINRITKGKAADLIEKVRVTAEIENIRIEFPGIKKVENAIPTAVIKEEKNKTKIIISSLALIAIVIAVIAWYLASVPSPAKALPQKGIINLNLGTLYPNEMATIETSKNITLNGGNYTFKLLNFKQEVREDFREFAIKLIFYNYREKILSRMISLGLFPLTMFTSWLKATDYSVLEPGVYDLIVIIYYQVEPSVIPVNFSNVIVKMGNETLVSIIVGVQEQPTNFQNLSVKPIYFNLDELGNGTSGSFTYSSTISIPSGGEYLFRMINETELKEDFSSFLVTITLSNSTEKISLTLGFQYLAPIFGPTIMVPNNSVYLSPGVYKMSITIHYNLYIRVKPMSFRGTLVEVGNTPLLNVNFTL